MSLFTKIKKFFVKNRPQEPGRTEPNRMATKPTPSTPKTTDKVSGLRTFRTSENDVAELQRQANLTAELQRQANLTAIFVDTPYSPPSAPCHNSYDCQGSSYSSSSSSSSSCDYGSSSSSSYDSGSSSCSSGDY